MDSYKSMVESTGVYEIVEAASLQFNQPDLPTAINTLASKGVDRIVVMPLFLYQGVHIQEDIPEILAEEKQKYPGVEFIVTGNIGVDERVGQIIMDRIREVC